MKQLSVMFKPTSSLCNMRCKYCFYCDESQLRSMPSFGMMSVQTRRAVLTHIFSDLESGDRLTLAFQGGEPTLIGLDVFRQIPEEVASYAKAGVSVRYALQTNGLALDDAWCAFLKEHHFLVGLSLDGPADYHDGNRVDAQGKGTYRQVIAAKERMDRFGVDYNILMVLTSQLTRHPQQVWRFLTSQHIDYVQLIPCLGPIEGQASPMALTPERYAKFYIELFAQWYQAYQQGQYISVKLFDDIINLLAFGECNACGLTGRCQAQIIVEADGSVYPCDFYALDAYRAGSLAEQPLSELYQHAVMDEFRHRGPQPLEKCGDCPYWNICGGGCKRMRSEVFCSPANGQCGHRLFLDACMERMQTVALQIRRNAYGVTAGI